MKNCTLKSDTSPCVPIIVTDQSKPIFLCTDLLRHHYILFLCSDSNSSHLQPAGAVPFIHTAETQEPCRILKKFNVDSLQ
jgi:hypothetical protein